MCIGRTLDITLFCLKVDRPKDYTLGGVSAYLCEYVAVGIC